MYTLEMLDQIERHLGAIIGMAVDLDTSGVKRVPLPTGWTCTGLLSHQRYVLRFWIGNVICGADLPVPWTDDSPDEDWKVPDSVTVHTCAVELTAEWQRMRELLRVRPVDEPAALADDDGTRPTVAWVLSHLLAEIARHAGHLDIVSELHQSPSSEQAT